MSRLHRGIALGLVLIPILFAGAADWPQFRGPTGMGIALKEKAPVQWSDDSNIAWKVALPGPGASSPIVVGDRVLVTCYTGYGLPGKKGGDVAELKRHLLCFDRAGKPLWRKEVPSAVKESSYTGGYITKHGYASATPASDGKNVYVFFGASGVLAFDLDGNERWRHSVGTGTHGWGSGTSPVLYKDLVIVNASVESGSLIALHKDTGKPAWTAKGMKSSWVTPVIVDAGPRKELVVSVQGKLRAFDPQQGTELWTCPGVKDYVCSSIVAHDGIVFAIGGRPSSAAVIAVKAGGEGEVKELWRAHKGSNVSSPIYRAGRLYWTNEQSGTAFCLDATTGAVLYAERLQPAAGLIYASPTAADGKIYYVSRNDGVYVIDEGPKLDIVAHNVIKSDPSVFNASPAIADGRLYLRSDRYLYCIGTTAK